MKMKLAEEADYGSPRLQYMDILCVCWSDSLEEAKPF